MDQGCFACPQCQDALDGTETALICRGCGQRFHVENGLYTFTSGHSTHGELRSEAMREVLDHAEHNGWRAAVRDKLAPQSSLAAQLITDPRRRDAVAILQGVGGRVLDFGCGYGGLSLALLDLFDEVVALDGSKERVSFLNIIARQEHLQNLHTVYHNDILHLPFRDGSFDAVVLVGVLEYLPGVLRHLSIEAAHLACLNSFWRILRPGGRLLIHSKNRFGWQYLLGGRDHSGLRFAPALPRPLADLILRLSGRGPYRIINYSDAGYRTLMRKAGFTDVQLYWPIPGYQFPDHVVDLQADLAAQLAPLAANYFSPWRARAVMAMAQAGVLSKFVPYHGILATKPA